MNDTQNTAQSINQSVNTKEKTKSKNGMLQMTIHKNKTPKVGSAPLWHESLTAARPILDVNPHLVWARITNYKELWITGENYGCKKMGGGGGGGGEQVSGWRLITCGTSLKFRGPVCHPYESIFMLNWHEGKIKMEKKQEEMHV